jgi:hypothetical protein
MPAHIAQFAQASASASRSRTRRPFAWIRAVSASLTASKAARLGIASSRSSKRGAAYSCAAVAGAVGDQHVRTGRFRKRA